MLSLLRGRHLWAVLRGAWLYPLFVTRQAQETVSLASESEGDAFRLIDSRVGQGAVFLYSAMGISSVHGFIVSELAIERATELGVTLSADTVVPTLQCMTETMLDGPWGVAEAVAALESRLTNTFLSQPGGKVEMVYSRQSAIGSAISSVLSTPLSYGSFTTR